MEAYDNPQEQLTAVLDIAMLLMMDSFHAPHFLDLVDYLSKESIRGTLGHHQLLEFGPDVTLSMMLAGIRELSPEQMASLGLDLAPGIGELKGFIEVITGYDLMTQDDLGDWRWAGLLGVVGLSRAKALSKISNLPLERHHFATNKNKMYTPQMQEIAERYNLSLNDEWNMALMPHRGRHPNAYHEFVAQGMIRASSEAGDDVAKFLEFFQIYVRDPVLSNPELLRRSGW